MLFVIGLLVMIFSLMGGALSEATYDTTTVSLELGFINSTGYTLTNLGADSNPTVTSIVNNTAGAETIALTLITNTAGVITNSTAVTEGSVNISYTYEDSNTGTEVINDTTSAIAGVTGWFSIFIVIGAMVVLILLAVIIITSIRGSGMIEGGNSQGGNVGYA